MKEKTAVGFSTGFNSDVSHPIIEYFIIRTGNLVNQTKVTLIPDFKNRGLPLLFLNYFTSNTGHWLLFLHSLIAGLTIINKNIKVKRF
ncbi:MAG: hypothetical protein WA120_03270 [Candidatus Hydromicrobium sp.]